uniref:Uncharacterized protein n=2 Tax=Rhizophora mucronata TaxID=61149 RepID=A0A2P2K013_RHIMU
MSPPHHSTFGLHLRFSLSPHMCTQMHVRMHIETLEKSSNRWISAIELKGLNHKMAYLELEYSKSLPVAEKIMRATSASQRTESSAAFLKSPRLLLEKVTCLAVMLSIFLILIFSLAIAASFSRTFL